MMKKFTAEGGESVSLRPMGGVPMEECLWIMGWWLRGSLGCCC